MYFFFSLIFSFSLTNSPPGKVAVRGESGRFTKSDAMTKTMKFRDSLHVRKVELWDENNLGKKSSGRIVCQLMYQDAKFSKQMQNTNAFDLSGLDAEEEAVKEKDKKKDKNNEEEEEEGSEMEEESEDEYCLENEYDETFDFDGAEDSEEEEIVPIYCVKPTALLFETGSFCFFFGSSFCFYFYFVFFLCCSHHLRRDYSSCKGSDGSQLRDHAQRGVLPSSLIRYISFCFCFCFVFVFVFVFAKIEDETDHPTHLFISFLLSSQGLVWEISPIPQITLVLSMALLGFCKENCTRHFSRQL